MLFQAILCQGEDWHLLILDIDDQHIYIYIQGHSCFIFEFKYALTSNFATNSKGAFEERLILDGVTFDIIC